MPNKKVPAGQVGAFILLSLYLHQLSFRAKPVFIAWKDSPVSGEVFFELPKYKKPRLKQTGLSFL